MAPITIATLKAQHYLGDVIIYPVLIVARTNNEVTVRRGFTVFISLYSFDTSSDNVSWLASRHGLKIGYIIIHSKYFPDSDGLKAHV